jgi:protein-tyrosine phosphatase
MIDLHCHILHAMDDGPADLSRSIQLAQNLIHAGYHTVAATPHMVPGTPWMPTVAEIDHRIASLTQAIDNAGLALSIVAGMEIALDSQIPEMLAEDRLMGLGGSSCLLIELPFHQLPSGWNQLIFTIQSMGYKVLLAHPERCYPLSADWGQIDRLIDSGVLLQVNWGSIMGRYGRTAARTANHLAAHGWITCLASDSHHPDSRYPTHIRKAVTSLVAQIGGENLSLITSVNPLRLLNGQKTRPMTTTNGISVQSKKRWWMFWHVAEEAK